MHSKKWHRKSNAWCHYKHLGSSQFSLLCDTVRNATSQDHLTGGKRVTWWVVVKNCAFKLGQCEESAFTHNTNPPLPANAMCLTSPPPQTSSPGRLFFFFLWKVVNVTHDARILSGWRKRFIHMPVIESPQKWKKQWDGIHLCVQECLFKGESKYICLCFYVLRFCGDLPVTYTNSFLFFCWV